jgi:hypothetical protein
MTKTTKAKSAGVDKQIEKFSTDAYIEQAIKELEAIRSGLDGIRVEEVDAGRAPGWALSIEETAARIRKFAVRLRAAQSPAGG